MKGRIPHNPLDDGMTSVATPKAAADSTTTWDAELFERLYDLVHSAGFSGQALDVGLRKLKVRYGKAVFAELLYLLSHLRFEPEEAVEHWGKIMLHRDRMARRLGASVDIRVALISYFLEVNRKLKNPKIIEMKLFEETRASAYRDELTGLYNYRLFREYLNQEVQRSDRDCTPLSLVLLDVDHFKAYNDTNGHELGNQTLSTVARLMSSGLRPGDIAARYGGEEFVLILPSTSKVTAHLLAERIRESIESHCFVGEENLPGGRLTVSLGVATFPADADSGDELVRHADRAMYVAKADGRNQVRLYGQSRRSYDRVDAALPGSFRMLETVPHDLVTVNLSQGGILFETGSRPSLDSLVELRLVLPAGEITASGHVVHAETIEGSRHQVAVHLSEAEGDGRELLASFLLDGC